MRNCLKCRPAFIKKVVSAYEKIADKITSFSEIIKRIGKYCPEYFLLFAFRVILGSFLPVLSVYIPKLIIDGLTKDWGYGAIARLILLFGIILLGSRLLISFLDKKSALCTEKFSSLLSEDIGSRVMLLSLADIESPAIKDSIRLAGNAKETIRVCELIKNILQNIITLCGYIFIVSRLNVIFIVLVVILLIIKVIFAFINDKFNRRLRVLTAQNDRTGSYLESLCYFNQGAAKEIRANSIQTWFLDKVRMFRKRMVKLQCQEFWRNWLFESINVVLFAFLSLYILWNLSMCYVEGTITIADFSLYFTTITAMTAAFGTLTSLLSQLNQQILTASDFMKLKNMPETAERLETAELPKAVKIAAESEELDKAGKLEKQANGEIVFSNVWFAYPGTEDYVLRDITIKIAKQEKLVVVGYNGAGKTTFIKLLCKFYRPTKGRIFLNGTDIWEIPNEEYYKMLGAVFQDFVLFAFTMEENITFHRNHGDLRKLLEMTDIFTFINSLPDNLGTYLSKKFSSDGVEVSGGQGQKIALARALYKNPSILILDEPTASLDIKAERNLYEKFLRAAAEKTAVFISHRLAASQIADAIAVFSEGRIVEYGSHKELLAKQGIYADMFRKQSEPYVGGE